MTSSAQGHQLKVDSSYQPDQAQFPDMGAFSKGMAFTWAGRGAGDKFALTLKKSSGLQRAYMKNGAIATALSPIQEDSASVTIAFGLGDSALPVFLARQFRIAAGKKTDLTFGPDSVIGLLSSTPGDLRLDSLLPPLDLASATLLGGRSIHLDELQVDEPFTLVLATKAPLLPDSVRTLIHNGTEWVPGPKPETGGRYVFAVTPDIRAVAVLERLNTQEIIPKLPATPASRSLFGNILRISPSLTGEEKATTPTYQVDLVSVDLSGRLDTRHSEFVSVDSSTSLTLDGERHFAYRVAYRTQADKVVRDSVWIPLLERPLEASALQSQVPTRRALFKHLVGFPFSRPFASVFPVGPEPPKEMSLKTLKDGAWTPLTTADNPMLERGRGYLFGATSPFQAQVSGATLPGLEPDTLHLDETGWHLISNPFPFPIRETDIQMDASALSKPLALVRKDTTAGSKAEYEWIPKDTLAPFEGYLIHAFKAATLVINPLGSKAPLARKAAPRDPAFLELRLSEATRGLARMAFFTPGFSRPTPYFPPLEGRVEMRVGGNGGYLLKPEARLDSIETEVEVRSDRARTVSLTRSGALPEMLLIDQRSGQVYRHGDLDSIEVEAGSNIFTLMTGKPGTLDDRVDKVLAAMPRAFSLSQNYPNPFRGVTEIRIQVSRGLGRIVQGRVDVLDLSGRLLQSIPMQDLRIGTYTLRLGSQAWKPGIYVYRLTVKTELGTNSLQKRMLVQ
ncbi:MAG TPA: hypothetical protein VK465_09925 [Fibrobacteria bacterium]|nr:hypothetical protein [Fibrobacteria bacterium]